MLRCGCKRMKKNILHKAKLHWTTTPFAFRVYSSTFALIIALIMNALASFSVFNGVNTGDVSDLYPTLLTPSGFTFTIWGLIYVSLIYFSLNQLRLLKIHEFSTSRHRLFQLHGWYFLVSMLNAIWIILWQYQILFGSLIVIIAMLYGLVQIILLLRKQPLSLRFPFSLYAAWITVATVANFSIYLVTTEYVSLVTIAWNQPGAVIQTSLVLMIVSLLTGIWMWREKDVIVGAVVIWSWLGLIYRHAIEFEGAYITVLETTIILLVLLSLWTFYVMSHFKRFH